ncbi:hypothetical protein EDB81DRAFT_640839 [Dactylonectria macrodidyma]|uniref:Uncharacterized protein n=1 Tax=Dactylonectria macrodidyma TaxID=307937 RepID=A0A9P9FMW2_9HYPO|nr:hypothetical protein EDB81DRAFT_640839 [Dactylonectria macrodidyma]
MFASADGPSVPKDKEEKGFNKILPRAKTMLKRDENTKQISTVPTLLSPATDIRSQTGCPNDKAALKKNKYEDFNGVIKVSMKDLFEERVRKLSEEYGLEIKLRECYLTESTENIALHMEKPIGIRVYRTCAACSITFSSAKEWLSCGFTKYKRYMPKRMETEKIASRKRRAARLQANKENASIIPDYGADFEETVLKRLSKTIFPDGIPNDITRKKYQRQKCANYAQLKLHKANPKPDADVLKTVPAKIEALKLG